jgi:hypothetical protein
MESRAAPPCSVAAAQRSQAAEKVAGSRRSQIRREFDHGRHWSSQDPLFQISRRQSLKPRFSAP